MKSVCTLVLILILAGTAQAEECGFASAEDILSVPLPAKADQEIDVTEQQSVEGGSWSIYRNGGATPQRIVRTDYGETGRTEHMLVLSGTNAFVIRRTYLRYSVPIYLSGSAVVREEVDYFRFCGGKLDVPAEAEPDEAYMKAAQEAAAQFFTAPEIAEAVKAAALTPPLWK